MAAFTAGSVETTLGATAVPCIRRAGRPGNQDRLRGHCGGHDRSSGPGSSGEGITVETLWKVYVDGRGTSRFGRDLGVP